MTKVKLLYFSADYCGPCKSFYPVVEEFCKEHDVELSKLDVFEADDLSAYYKVGAIPFLVAIKDGKELYRGAGTRTKKELKALCGF